PNVDQVFVMFNEQLKVRVIDESVAVEVSRARLLLDHKLQRIGDDAGAVGPLTPIASRGVLGRRKESQVRSPTKIVHASENSAVRRAEYCSPAHRRISGRSQAVLASVKARDVVGDRMPGVLDSTQERLRSSGISRQRAVRENVIALRHPIPAEVIPRVG